MTTRPSDPPAGFAQQQIAPFTTYVGPFFDKIDDDGSVVRAFRIADCHANVHGIAHGGMLMTAADTVLARIVRTATDQPFVTLRMTSDFVGPARIGDWVEGRGRVTRTTRSLIFVVGALTVGHHQILRASAIFRLLPRKISEPANTAKIAATDA